MAQVESKLCCNCIHYLLGVLENPCAKNVKSVGYLMEGCWRWKSKNGEEAEIPTKRCSTCGQELTIDHFYKNAKLPGGYSPACKSCFSYKDKIRMQKEDRKKRMITTADLERGVKVCNHCMRELPISQFTKHASTKDGFEPKCKECKRELRKKAKKEKQSHENRINRC